MKSISLAVAASVMLLLASCNNGNTDTKTETKMVDTTVVAEVTPPPPPVAVKPANVVLMWHKVSNYDKWLTGYLSHDTMRLAAGLHNYVIGRDLADPNYLLVALKMDDLEKAKAFTSSADLKTTMQKVGVVGKPIIIFLDTQVNDTSSNAITTRVMLTHKVKDYDAWKTSFDSHKQARIDAGLVDRALGYSLDDKNSVTVVCGVTDLKKAKAFFSSKDLQDKMTSAGVVGAPSVHYYTVAKTF
jgi:hypothetical protein